MIYISSFLIVQVVLDEYEGAVPLDNENHNNVGTNGNQNDKQFQTNMKQKTDYDIPFIHKKNGDKNTKSRVVF